MSTLKPKNENSVTPLGLAVAALILCLLASLAIPRLRAVSVSAERNHPEAPRILSSFESPRPTAVMSGGCGGGGVSATQ